jgi:hypothetical protein
MYRLLNSTSAFKECRLIRVGWIASGTGWPEAIQPTRSSRRGEGWHAQTNLVGDAVNLPLGVSIPWNRGGLGYAA